MCISDLSNDELFYVLLCDKEPVEPYNRQDYADEWNKRCAEWTNKDGNGYAISC